MRTVNNFLGSALKLNIQTEAELALINSSDDVIRIQREQLFAGERSDDTQIFNIKTGSEYYSPSYAKYKGKDSPIDLKDKGGFYRGLDAKPEDGGLLIESDDPKAKELKDNYGEEILGLGTYSKNELAPIAGNNLAKGVALQLNER